MEKSLKRFDLAVQLLILLACLIRSILLNDLGEMAWAYFTLGGWQLLSFAVHHFLHFGWKNQLSRWEFGKLLSWILVTFTLLCIFHLLGLPLLLFFMMAMLLAGPAMAIWYFLIGLGELRNMYYRDLIHLK